MRSVVLAGQPQSGLRDVERSSFVAGRSACMGLSQRAADIVCVDPFGRALGRGRMLVSARTDESLHWTALIKGEGSVAVDLRTAEVRELVMGLAAAPDCDGGLVVENNVDRSWLANEVLTERRYDLIQVHIQGQSDGGPQEVGEGP